MSIVGGLVHTPAEQDFVAPHEARHRFERHAWLLILAGNLVIWSVAGWLVFAS